MDNPKQRTILAGLAAQFAETAANDPMEALIQVVSQECARHPALTIISALTLACHGLGLTVRELGPPDSDMIVTINEGRSPKRPN